MGKSKKSPAKIARSLLRILEYKQAYLEDCWETEINIDQNNKKIIWKASSLLNLTLKQNVQIVETRNSSFKALNFSEKLKIFQNMWIPDHDSFNFFACMHEHIKRSSSQCNHFCSSLSSPQCGRLAYFLSTSTWPPA